MDDLGGTPIYGPPPYRLQCYPAGLSTAEIFVMVVLVPLSGILVQAQTGFHGPRALMSAADVVFLFVFW